MTFVTKKIRSQYLDEEFEVSCWEMQQGKRTLTIIEHAALEYIIFNELAQPNFSYDMMPIVGIANYPVAQCTMTDDSRRIIAIGEAHPDSLVNKISRQNPVIMAYNRAFDRAAIRYLDLEGKVYSSEEISDEDAAEGSNEDVSYDGNFSLDIDEIPEAPEKPEAQPEPKTENPGDVVINFGKRYRGQGKTVAEIYATDPDWVNYTVGMNTDAAGEATRKQVEALKAYKAMKEGTEA